MKFCISICWDLCGNEVIMKDLGFIRWDYCNLRGFLFCFEYRDRGNPISEPYDSFTAPQGSNWWIIEFLTASVFPWKLIWIKCRKTSNYCQEIFKIFSNRGGYCKRRTKVRIAIAKEQVNRTITLDKQAKQLTQK